ncbi:glycosyltransferase [Kovacikia minuta CCNUW1]|uniref:glycosyltransferase n=1 Tax=Kovacikia minuta TaxID=2931930 RepID=UPI001CCF0FA0|nr:glycosyltransferase [Kovacikia minuta]UBF27979.1 glycosyltransferase [Kovacikia minuta CCNUW1]
MHPKQRHFHLWMPNMLGFKGGVQVYSAFFLRAIQSLCPQGCFDVFLKHDSQTSPQIEYLPDTRFHFAGRFPDSVRTLAFVAQLVGQGIWQCPDLIITTHLNFTPAAYQLKRLRGISYWTIAHGVEAWNVTRPGLQTALHHADLILAVSHYTRDRLLKEQNLDPSRVLLLPNTFDASRFQIGRKPDRLLQQYQLKPEQPVILTVNRLSSTESYKGYDKVLAALPKIRQLIPDVHYIIVGKGDDRPRIEQLIAQLQLQNCVTLAGFVPDNELGDYYNLCDVFAMPSKCEGFGIVYLEALACGKPALGGNQDGAIDALLGGELGALVNPDDEAEIAQTIIQILQGDYPHPIIYQPEALRQRVVDTYGFEQFQRTLANHLRKTTT